VKLPLSPCNRAGARLLLALALMLITWMTLTPSPGPIQERVNDKLGHALAFFLLALLVHASWPRHHFNWRLALPLLGYGVAIECIQYFVPNRFFSLADILADAGGIALYWLLLSLLALWLTPRTATGRS
jgi:VanZ family protein